ncbi:hypothetical protein ACT691_06785 [Vibrio metschnikovii]
MLMFGEVIHGDIDRVLNESPRKRRNINQIEQRTENNLNEKAGCRAECFLLNEVGDYHREDETQRQKLV